MRWGKRAKVSAIDPTANGRGSTGTAPGWRDYVIGEVAAATGQTPEVTERLKSALEDFLYIVENRRGFATWPIYVASGQKPA